MRRTVELGQTQIKLSPLAELNFSALDEYFAIDIQ